MAATIRLPTRSKGSDQWRDGSSLALRLHGAFSSFLILREIVPGQGRKLAHPFWVKESQVWIGSDVRSLEFLRDSAQVELIHPGLLVSHHEEYHLPIYTGEAKARLEVSPEFMR